MIGWLYFVGAVLVAAGSMGIVRRLAMRHRLIDVPNERSSHVTVTPRGGGAAIVFAVSLAWISTIILSPTHRVALVWPFLASLTVAAVGFIDDRRGLPARTRFAVHSIAALMVLFGTVDLGRPEVPLVGSVPLMAGVCMWLALVWFTNLFNFMDGIDGLAGMEGAFVSAGIALCVFLTSGALDRAALMCLATAGACLGFLGWNWPPARIFLGDIGSGFLGFMLGTLGLWMAAETHISLWVPMILFALFVTDATVTLLRRISLGECWYEAHRSHAYQRLSRRWGGHRKVTLGALSLNLLWLLPLAILATVRIEWAGTAALVAYVPLVAGAIMIGSGLPDAESSALSQPTVGS